MNYERLCTEKKEKNMRQTGEPFGRKSLRLFKILHLFVGRTRKKCEVLPASFLEGLRSSKRGVKGLHPCIGRRGNIVRF